MSAPPVKTAEVEHLTATVHVLKVGNRQVTKTMVRQLDTIYSIEEMDPFGRVNLDQGYTIVGAHKLTGALVVYTYVPTDEIGNYGPSIEDLREGWREIRGTVAELRELPLLILGGLS